MKEKLKKLNSRKGFTLVEMLVTIVVMLMVTEIIVICVQLSTKYYHQSVMQSESSSICGALAVAIQEELQYATKVQPVDSGNFDADGYYSGFQYYSRARQHGSNCSIVCVDGKVYIQKGGINYGVVGSETYTYNLQANLECKWNKNGYFLVDLKIVDGNDTLANQTFKVYPLNKGY